MGSEVLVTGGRGFIGVNLLRKLTEKNSVSTLDSLRRSSPTGWDEIAEQVALYEGDILNQDDLVAFKDKEKIIHLAAYGSVIESIKDPMANFQVNVLGTLNVLKAAADHQIKRVILASTGGALIGDAEPPVSETSLPKPISPYGASKLCGEAYCHAFAKSFDLETVCLRFGNVYGPHSAHKKGAVTVFIKALLKDEPIHIYGDGSASRDYIHVADLARGIEAGLDVSIQDHDVFHLAAGRETSVLELAEMLRDIAGKPNHPIQHHDARKGEVARNFADYTKANQTFGFKPKWDIREGLAETFEWFSKQDESLLNVETTDS